MSQSCIRAKINRESRSIENDEIQVDIEWFNGNGDFSLWKRRMYAYLSVSGLKDIPYSKICEYKEDRISKGWKSKKKKILADEESRLERCEKEMKTIFLNVGDHVSKKIEKCITSRNIESTRSTVYVKYSPKSSSCSAGAIWI